jgi:hypothetical protein
VHVARSLVDLLEEQFDGKLTHPIPRETHGRHRDAALGREVIVVVADNRQFIGYPDSELGRRLDNADCEQI